jgi:hypothetical protein
MAYCTTIVPKNDKACPAKNNAAFFFQLIYIRFYSMVIIAMNIV